jgi:hypothetical protein
MYRFDAPISLQDILVFVTIVVVAGYGTRLILYLFLEFLTLVGFGKDEKLEAPQREASKPVAPEDSAPPPQSWVKLMQRGPDQIPFDAKDERAFSAYLDKILEKR